MSNIINFRTGRRLTANTVFDAYEQDDPTKTYHFEAFRDEEDMGVYINFVDNHKDLDGSSKIRDMMWIDADQCEQFGNALLAAAELIRKQPA